MIRRPPRSTHCISSAASDVYKRQVYSIIEFLKYLQTASHTDISNVNSSARKLLGDQTFCRYYFESELFDLIVA